MAVLFTVLYNGIRQLTEDYVISRLQHDTDSIIAGLQLEKDGNWRLPQERMPTIYQRVQSGHYYVVVINEQRIRSRSLFDIEIDLPVTNKSEYHCHTTTILKSEAWLACVQQVKKNESKIAIWVAEDISSLEKTQRHFLSLAVGTIMFTVLVLLLSQYYILKRGFKQLDKVRNAIKHLHLGTKDVTSLNPPLEILPLVKEIDRLLAQLSQRVKRSRNALGNLAHELKRPLQRYSSQLQTLNSEQRLEGDSILTDIQSVVERELKRARIVGIATPGRYTVIDEDLFHLIKVMHTIYPQKLIETDYPEKLVLPHDRDDILELLGNLLDNACKFANKNILICFGFDEQGWRIVIEDDGDGVTQEALESIAERGVRLDESVQGHGLGLSICKDIVESYSGTITFESAKLGGLAVVVFLPNTD